MTLPAGTAVTLESAAQIVGGCVVFDGASLALVTEHPRGREIVVLALASGRALQTVALPPGSVRIAARRGLAVVHDAARRLAIIDLRFARHLGAVVTDDDVTDVAIDPDGRLLAIRLACGDLELAPIGEGMGAAIHLPASLRDASNRDADVTKLEITGLGMSGLSSESRSSDEPPSEPRSSEPEPRLAEPRSSEPQRSEPKPPEPRLSEPPDSDVQTSSARPFNPSLPVVVDALEPRPIRDRLPRAAALAELDREIRSVTLWALQAISNAWDTRRLGYGNEGHHPYEHEVAAIVGKNAGFAPDYLAAAQDALVEHEAALAADPQHRSPSTPIAELIDEFGLSQAAIDVLLVIAAPSLHGDVARLFGILGNDPGRAMMDELLVQHVLAGRVSRHDVAAELDPRAPLVRLGIVDIKPARPRPFAALEVDPTVLSRLRGEPPEFGVAPVVRHADRALDAIELAPGVLISAISALARVARPARIAIRGRAGGGRRSLLTAFAKRAGRSLGVIDATALPHDAERFVEVLQTALRRAHLAGLIPVVHGLDTVVFHEHRGSDLARDILAAHPGPLAVLCLPGASSPLPLGHAVIDLPPLSETERLGVWQRALAGTGRWLRDVAGLAARYRVGPGVIHRAIAATADHDSGAPSDDRIDVFLRQSRDLRLADHARRVDRLARWSDLVLPPDIMDSLRELVGRVRHRRTVFEDWGMGAPWPPRAASPRVYRAKFEPLHAFTAPARPRPWLGAPCFVVSDRCRATTIRRAAQPPTRSAGTGLRGRRPTGRTLTRPVSGGDRRLEGSTLG